MYARYLRNIFFNLTTDIYTTTYTVVKKMKFFDGWQESEVVKGTNLEARQTQVLNLGFVTQ